jgi:hypothetical protein
MNARPNPKVPVFTGFLAILVQACTVIAPDQRRGRTSISAVPAPYLRLNSVQARAISGCLPILQQSLQRERLSPTQPPPIIWVTCGRSTTGATQGRCTKIGGRNWSPLVIAGARRTWSYINEPCLLKDDQPVADFRPRNTSLPVKQIRIKGLDWKIAVILLLSASVVQQSPQGGP